MGKKFVFEFNVTTRDCRGVVPVVIDRAASFEVLFEEFLWYLENGIQSGQIINKLKLTYNGSVLATTVTGALGVGLGISKMEILVIGTDGALARTLEKFYRTIHSIECFPSSDAKAKIEIKATRAKPYKIMDSEVETSELPRLIKMWNSMHSEVKHIVKDHEINPVLLAKPEASNWVMEYYLPDEVERARSLIDSDPQKAKDVLFVMQHMLMHYRKGE